MARKFFYVCAGLLCLALAYHFGATSAAAQAPGNPIVASISPTFPPYYDVVVTANGDVYGANNAASSWTPLGNVFVGGAPTPVKQTSLGALKVRYR